MKPPPFPAEPVRPGPDAPSGVPEALQPAVQAQEEPFVWLGPGALQLWPACATFALVGVLLGLGVAFEPEGNPALGAAIVAGGIAGALLGVWVWRRQCPATCVLDLAEKRVWSLSVERRPRAGRAFACGDLYLHVKSLTGFDQQQEKWHTSLQLELAGPERPVAPPGGGPTVASFVAAIVRLDGAGAGLPAAAEAVEALELLAPWAGLTSHPPELAHRLRYLVDRRRGVTARELACFECGEATGPGQGVATCRTCGAVLHGACLDANPAGCVALGCKNPQLVVAPFGFVPPE